MPLIPLLNPGAPGSFTTVKSTGNAIPEITGFATCYMFLYALNIPVGTRAATPTPCYSLTDVITKFGVLSDVARESIGIFFKNTSASVLQVIAIANGTTSTKQNKISLAAAGYTVTVPIAGSLYWKVNSLADHIWTIENSLDPDIHNPGYVCFPEFNYTHQNLVTDAPARLAIAAAIDNLLSTGKFDGVQLLDVIPPTGANYTYAAGEGQNLITEIIADRSNYAGVGATGDTALYSNYLKTENGFWIPPCMAVAGLGLRRFDTEGWIQPPAGTKFKPLGIQDVWYRYDSAEHKLLNNISINICRWFYRYGVVCYGARTMSSDPIYKWINSAQIISVFRHVLRHQFDDLVFTALEGGNGIFDYITQGLTNLCLRFFQAGALYGANSGEAFAVFCKPQNNPPADIQNGIVRSDVFIAVTPTLEQIQIGVVRTAIGEVQATLKITQPNQGGQAVI
jgi:hypothetical protein